MGAADPREPGSSTVRRVEQVCHPPNQLSRAPALSRPSHLAPSRCAPRPAHPQVRLKCGLKEVLSKVEEPSRCEYTAQLQTPAACTPALAQALRSQLAEQQRLVEGGGEEAAARDEL